MATTEERISWPGWETVGMIGRGSFGAVYEIQRRVFRETEKAALKVISIPQNSGDIDDMYNDGYDDESITVTFQSHLESIVSEYSLMRKLNGSANIVNCEDIRYVQHNDKIGWDIFIKMELLTPLAKALPARVEEQTVVKLARDMCAALELCSKHGIIHRDIKPQNIFVSEHGDYKLGDFGIAKTVEKTMGGTKIGTYKYMAPEVYNNQPYGCGADIYSLGLVLYWLLNERRMPFMPQPPQKLLAGMDEESRNRRLAGEPLSAPAHGSAKLKKIVLKACAFDPAQRYHTAAEMLQDLEAAFGPTRVVEAVAPVVPTPPEPPQPPQPPEPPQPPVKEEPDSGEEKIKSRKAWPWFLIAAVVILIVILLCVRFCSGPDSKPEPDAVDTPSGNITPTEDDQANTPPAVTDDTQDPNFQADWTEWMEVLPEHVSADAYEVEELTMYSSRKMEYTSSNSSSLSGWNHYDTVEADAGYSPWSEWSESAVSGSDTRQVESKSIYRYRDKEKTTGSTSVMSGWNQYDVTYHFSDYGGWSGWSTTPAYESNTRQVQTATQYRYRSISYSSSYTDWSSWGGWTFDRQSTSDFVMEDSRTVWGYYYFQCPSCGIHMHGWDITCPKWAGGCGKAYIPQSSWHQIYHPTSWNNSGLKDFHGTSKYYTYLDGQLVFKWTDGGTKTQYRYATRDLVYTTHYGSWSSWSDTPAYSTDTLEVETRTVYRYRDRQEIPTYYFWRWGGWSSWSDNPVMASQSREVEYAQRYRYRDKVTETTYYFWRWSDWSDWTEMPAEASDTVEVQTHTLYRYRSK